MVKKHRLSHEEYMNKALLCAAQAYKQDEVPIGAVVVSPQGSIVSQGFNQVEHEHTQAAHAEMQVIMQAGKKQADWRLEDHWVYVTLEPCLMCMGFMYLSRIKGCVFAAHSKLFSYRLDIMQELPLYKRDLVMIGGIQEQESVALLKNFFQKKRKD